MAKIQIPNEAWVVVCDGRKALILRNAGDPDLLNLVTVDTFSDPAPATSEMGTERPGRVHQSVGSSRSAVEQTDWHDQAEEAFLKQVADRLHGAVAGHDATQIVLVAPPRAMGMIRPQLSQQVAKALVGEVTKDYAGLTTPDIEKHLSALA
jgi:protein required for attachment to host cells